MRTRARTRTDSASAPRRARRPGCVARDIVVNRPNRASSRSSLPRGAQAREKAVNRRLYGAASAPPRLAVGRPAGSDDGAAATAVVGGAVKPPASASSDVEDLAWLSKVIEVSVDE